MISGGCQRSASMIGQIRIRLFATVAAATLVAGASLAQESGGIVTQRWSQLRERSGPAPSGANHVLRRKRRLRGHAGASATRRARSRRMCPTPSRRSAQQTSLGRFSWRRGTTRLHPDLGPRQTRQLPASAPTVGLSCARVSRNRSAMACPRQSKRSLSEQTKRKRQGGCKNLYAQLSLGVG